MIFVPNNLRRPTVHQSGKALHRLSSGLLAFSLFSIFLTGFAPTAHADDDLILELPPSQTAQEMKAAQNRTAAQAKTSVIPSRLRGRRGGVPSRHQENRNRVVGRLGQLDFETPIYRTRSTSSRQLTTAPAGTYVAIQDEAAGWIGVLMADGTTGWLEKSAIKPLEYQVVTTGQTGNLPVGSDIEDRFPRGSYPIFTGDAQTLLAEAYKYLGVRYVWGGNTKNGIDCSGFVKNVFASQGYRLPRTAHEQMGYGLPVPISQLQPGDRLYFDWKGGRVGHTGLYLGDGYFIHSSMTHRGVAVDQLNKGQWMRIFVCARR